MKPDPMIPARFRQPLLAVAICLSGFVMGLGFNRLYPQWRNGSERQVAREAFEFLEDLRRAQQRFFIEHGRYAADLQLLDTRVPPPIHFSLSAIRVTDSPRFGSGWRLSLHRAGRLTQEVQPYSVTFSERGFESDLSSIAAVWTPKASVLDSVAVLTGQPNH